PSSAHQMFGRAGRPQFDDRGYVFCMAHEDDVRLARWQEQYDQIPEDTKDPNLIRAKKRLKHKKPKRSDTIQYWNEAQFQKLITSPPGKLASRGVLPWRLLAYLLEISPEVERLRKFVDRRMMDPGQLQFAQKRLTRMLITLWSAGCIDLDPAPPDLERGRRLAPPVGISAEQRAAAAVEEFGGDLLEEQASPRRESGDSIDARATVETQTQEPQLGAFGALLQEALSTGESSSAANPQAAKKGAKHQSPNDDDSADEGEVYLPVTATPTDDLAKLLQFRSVNPLYGLYLIDQLGIADEAERIQALESVLEIPGSIFRDVRAPGPDELPPGPLATTWLDPLLIERGLASAAEIDPEQLDEDNYGRQQSWGLLLGDKLRRVFDSEYPGIS